MRTQQLAILDDAWRRSNDRREPHLWMAATAAPLAWVGSLAGLSPLIAVVVAVLAGIVAGVRLHELQAAGDRSWQRAWFLAEAGVALSLVSVVLIAIAAI